MLKNPQISISCNFLQVCSSLPSFVFIAAFFILSCHVLSGFSMSGAPNEKIVQNHLNVALLNVF